MRITLKAARTALAEIVAEYGDDYRYTAPSGAGCVNVHKGQTSCLVAKVLERLGVDVVGLCTRHKSLNSLGVSAIVEHAGVATDRDALSYLARAQGQQDSKWQAGERVPGKPWGQIRDELNERYPQS